MRSILPQSRRTTVLALSCVALIEILIGWIVWNGRQDALAAGYKEANQLARLLAEKTSDAFRSADLVLLNTKASLEQSQVAANDAAIREQLVARVRDLPHVRAFFVIGRDGFLTHDTDYPNTPRRSLADRDYFVTHQRNADVGIYVGMPLFSRSVDKWFVPVSRRIDRDGVFAGVVVAAIEPKFFEEFFRDLGLGAHDAVALFNMDTTLVARFPSQPELIGRKLPTLSLFQERLPHAATGTFTSSALEFGRAVISYRSLAPLPLVSNVVLNEEALLAGWRRSAIAWTVAAVMAPILVILLIIALERRRLEQRAAVKRAMKAQRLEALGQMTGGIVHDFNNVLAVATASLRLARSHGADEKYIVAGEQALERGGRLTAQLLSFAKRQELNSTVENLNDLLVSLQPIIRQAAGPGTQVSYEFDPRIPRCAVDRAQFDAAVVNLVVNAAQAMDGGNIVISTTPTTVRHRLNHGLKPGNYVALRVKDTGRGIPPADLKHVFEPFYTTKTEGTGLGLAQVYAFMHNIDGDARIDSRIGAGTTVELLFPCAEQHAVANAVTPEAVGAGQDSRLEGIAPAAS